jgi:hypothetical protein
MVHKRFVLVTLLAPSFSFASTATQSLSDTTRDLFDNLNENPAFVNVEGGKNYLRIGKAGGFQMLTNAGGFGLGIQVNTLVSAPVGHLDRNTKELIDAATALTKKGMPLQFTLGGDASGMKWGTALQYENARIMGEAAATTYDPRFVKTGFNLGLTKDEWEAAFRWTRDTWKVGTSGKTKGATGAETRTTLPAGMNEQTTDVVIGIARHKMGQYQTFLTGGQVASKAVFWSGGDNGTTSTQDNMDKLMGIETGAERQDKLTEGVTLYSKGWLSWVSRLSNGSQKKVQSTETRLSSGHGLEFAAASWVTLRAGIQASLYGNQKITTTTYADPNQGGTSGANTTNSTYMFQAIDSPTMGVGFKFGQIAVDATLGQDGTGDLGFTEKLLGKVEMTAQF